MNFQTTQIKKLQKGFTLIELLVVIAVLGVLATGLIAVIDPVDKIAAGNDSRAISDVTAIARAAERYAAANNGTWPANCAAIVTAGELKACPANPPNHTIVFAPATISVDLDSKKYTQPPAPAVATPFFQYVVASGKSCPIATVGSACP